MYGRAKVGFPAGWVGTYGWEFTGAEGLRGIKGISAEAWVVGLAWISIFGW